MAQGKLNDLAGKFGKGGPPGLGLGLKVLAVGAAAAYGISQSMYTGDLIYSPQDAAINVPHLRKSTGLENLALIVKSGPHVI